MRFPRGWLLVVATALAAGACDGDGTATVSSAGWSRVAHDEAVFGGEGDQTIASVTAGGPGLVAVGVDLSGGDKDAAVWTSSDGITWFRVPHDEAVFGGVGDQSMFGLSGGGPGLVAVGAESGFDWEAAVWVAARED